MYELLDILFIIGTGLVIWIIGIGVCALGSLFMWYVNDCPSRRMKRLKDAGLIGCLNDTGVDSSNYKEIIRQSYENIGPPLTQRSYETEVEVEYRRKGRPMDF